MGALLSASEAPSFHDLFDMGALARRAAPDGATLTAEELVALARFLRLCRNVRAALANPERGPRLADLAAAIVPKPELLRDLESTFDVDGVMRDDASAELLRLRRKLSDLDRRIRRTLEQMITRRDVQESLSEPLVTVREDRLVLPVRVERRGAVPGVVRGRSSSGQTFFVEPQATVKMGDEMREVIEDERREVLAILRALSATVRPELPDLELSAERLTELDVVKARARLGALYQGTEPKLDEPNVVFDIREGRHPLLDPRLRPLLSDAGLAASTVAEVVPVTVSLSRPSDTLIITGPNTGGKTATLKLIGLCHLMAQSGLLVPAGEGTCVSVYRTVHADIGDEQSLAQSLSTFSSHVARIARFFDALDLPALVLLDELGAGTDPREGEALGLAILQELSARGAHVVASTHYGAIKSYALATPTVLSVAMEWNEVTLSPTYRLSHGATGASHALPIARRLAMAGAVLRRAEDALERGRTQEMRRIEELTQRLSEAERERERLVADREEVRRTLAKVQARAESLARDRERLATEAREVQVQARKKVRGVVSFVESEAAKLLQQAASLGPAELRRRRKKLMAEAMDGIAEALPAGVGEPADLDETEGEAETGGGLAPAVGVRAKVRSLGVTGTILEVGSRGTDGQIRLDVNGKRMWVPVADLVTVSLPQKRATYTFTPAPSVDEPALIQELSLLGLRVDEALEATDRYLDRALTHGMPSVRLIHGFGTGRLRSAVKQFLEHHPNVQSFREGRDGEGGGGATVVTLR